MCKQDEENCQLAIEIHLFQLLDFLLFILLKFWNLSLEISIFFHGVAMEILLLINFNQTFASQIQNTKQQQQQG